MPHRITLDWQQKTILYWYTTRIVACEDLSFDSLYDVLMCAMVNGYRSRGFGKDVLILERRDSVQSS